MFRQDAGVPGRAAAPRHDGSGTAGRDGGRQGSTLCGTHE